MNKNSFMFYPELTDSDFNEKIYLKKEFRSTEVKERINYSKPFEEKKDFTLEPQQIFLKNYISVDTPYNGILIFHSTGVGKCLAKGTKIIMFNGEIKNVEDIHIGDLLMGDDSTPRKVTSLATGIDKMYNISQKYGDDYVVNSEHILCLKAEGYPLIQNKNNKYYIKWIENNKFRNKVFLEKEEAENLLFRLKNNNIIELSIKKYLTLSKLKKNILKGYKVSINLPEKELLIDPYIYGKECLNDEIPFIYKYNSKDNRLKLLKGIIENKNIKVENNILYLARSLGFNINNNIISEDNLITDIDVQYLKEDNYYGFTLDGNCRFLLGDFTVTHNTCTAIQIAEGFKKTLKNMNKKILILTNLRENFFNELYNHHSERRKKNPEDIVQCTGTSYQLGEDSIYLTYEQKYKEIEKLKKTYYQIMGYGKFANYIINRTDGWKGDEKDLTEKIKKIISLEFDNRVIIIDEIQNIKTDKREGLFKNIQPILQMIIKYAKNIKLVLMSATPMFDRPDEIIFYINLLLENDRRELINKNDIFNPKDGTLKVDAEKKLREALTGYISYIRGEKPYNFPFRIYPKNAVIPDVKYYMSGDKIDINKQLQFTKIVLCEMKDMQSKIYRFYLNKKIKEGKIKKNIDNKENEYIDSEISTDKKNTGLLTDLTSISNITYPIINNNIEAFSSYSIDSDVDNGYSGYYKSIKMIGTKKKIQYKYQSHAIFNKGTVNEKPFADEKYLSNYSIKFATILDTIKKSKGLILIFSQFIDIGILPLALILEQNGFDRECSEGENELLDYTANKLKGGGKKRQICYLCGNDVGYIDHDEKSKNYHAYRRAKYIMCFGGSKDIVKISKDEALKKFRSDKNRNGEEIKVFIGTRVIGEGLDFKRLRQVHIIDPWYNLSRHEQIIGRAIRNLSHKDLPLEERNVEIYQYAAVLDDNKDKLNERESIYLKNYRMAENKDIIIKNITRIMKESAVDCVLFRNLNIIESEKKIKQITSSGKVLELSIADKPYSTMCDYKADCNYKCNWMPNPRLNYPINTDTYNIRFASNDIEIIKKYIKNMFKENIIYCLGAIENKILEKDPTIDKLFIYSALEEIVNNKNEIVYDKFSREGYIIYRGDYYIFQPFDLERDELPLLYRLYPTNIKPNYINLDNIEVDYKIDNKKNIVEKMDENIFMRNIILNIEKIYNLHIQIASNKKIYSYAVISLVLDRLKKEDGILFIKNTLINYLTSNNKSNAETTNIIEYLNSVNKLINFYGDILYDKSKIKENIFVGFIFNNEYYILDTIEKTKDIKSIKLHKINFIKCSKETYMQIKFYRDLQKNKTKVNKTYNIIYGIIEYDKTKHTKIFKIVDKSVEEIVLTKDKKESKRSIITGRTCSTFQFNKLLELRNKVGMYKINVKYKIDFICEDLEIYFRYNNLLNTNNKIWFIDND